MLSVQEVVEQMLDAKLNTLIEERREEAAVEECIKYRKRLIAALIIGSFLLAITFINAYKTSYDLKTNLYNACKVRQLKDPAVERLATVYLTQELATVYLTQEQGHELAKGMPGYDAQQARILALRHLQDVYKTIPECDHYKN